MKFLSITLLLVISFQTFAKAPDPSVAKKENTVTMQPVFSIKPLRKVLRFKLKPGQNKASIFHKLTVINPSKDTIVGQLVMKEVPISATPNQTVFVDDFKKNKKNPATSLSDYVKLSKEEYTFKPGEKKIIAIEITVDRGFIGSKYATFGLKKIIKKNSLNQAKAVVNELDMYSTLIVDHSGSGKQSIAIEKVDRQNKFIDILVENNGNHLLQNPNLEAVIVDSKQELNKLSCLPHLKSTRFYHTSKRFFRCFLNKELTKNNKYILYTNFKADGGLFTYNYKTEI